MNKLSKFLYWFFGQGEEIFEISAAYTINGIQQSIDYHVRYKIFIFRFLKKMTLLPLLSKEGKAVIYDSNGDSCLLNVIWCNKWHPIFLPKLFFNMLCRICFTQMNNFVKCIKR